MTVIRNIRVQLLLAFVLFWCGLFTRFHAPQGFYDYLVRCGTMSTAFFMCLHAFIGNRKLTSVERILCGVLFVLLLVCTPLFLWEAMHVRVFADR